MITRVVRPFTPVRVIKPFDPMPLSIVSSGIVPPRFVTLPAMVMNAFASDPLAILLIVKTPALDKDIVAPDPVNVATLKAEPPRFPTRIWPAVGTLFGTMAALV